MPVMLSPKPSENTPFSVKGAHFSSENGILGRFYNEIISKKKNACYGEHRKGEGNAVRFFQCLGHGEDVEGKQDCRRQRHKLAYAKESCIPPSPPMQMTSTPMTETPAQTYTVTGVLYLRKNMAHSMGTMTTLVAVKNAALEGVVYS